MKLVGKGIIKIRTYKTPEGFTTKTTRKFKNVNTEGLIGELDKIKRDLYRGLKK